MDYIRPKICVDIIFLFPGIKPHQENLCAPVPQITLQIAGQLLTLRGENKNGTVYVSARDLLEALGYSVSWEDGQVVAERK